MRANPHDMIGAVIEASKRWRDERGAEARAEESVSRRRHKSMNEPWRQEYAIALAEKVPA
jgi:hypothetical protein